ncbi:MAG: CocE/NonD family hydrolase [Myxococcota bacterium]
MKHGTLDSFWKARNPRPHYKNVKPAVLTVGGWFDAEDLFGALETYRAFETQSPGAENTLVMGPWKHGAWAREEGDRHGDLNFGQKTSLYYQEQIELPFFRRHLKGAEGGVPPEALVFETGTNMWHRYGSWPPPGATLTTFYLGPKGTLTRGRPPGAGDLYDSYLSDPSKPVPYHGRPSLKIDKNYMSADQRFAARRPDVLVFATPELDRDVRFAGPLEAQLWVSTTGTDADFIVKVIDVHPPRKRKGKLTTLSGYQQLVRGEVMRGKFRDSFETPVPFEPGRPTEVRFALPDVCHSFRAGHRIMIQVQSSWFPLVDRNPQTFTDIYAAKESDFRAATHRIYRSASMPSALRATLLPTR